VERTYEEINEKLRAGKAVVVTADEFVSRVEDDGLEPSFRAVDVVTTGTFSPMCSSGVFLNFGHSSPRIRMHRVRLDGIPAYTGLAAVDAYLGATELPDDDPLNATYPGEFRRGGGHVIEDLVAGRAVHLRATSYGTDCYPRREIDTIITLAGINEAILFNPRNAYQNYNCAVNLGTRTLHTYMGVLNPNLGNAHYSTSGQLSPLLKDPRFRTIGIGTRIFLGGGVGHVAWHGTQHSPSPQKGPGGTELGPAGGTLAVIGDLKQMSPRWLMGASFLGYGATLTVGLGLPIPLLDEEVALGAAKPDRELYAPIVDYSSAYPNREPGNLGYVSYADLMSGTITVRGKKVPAAPLSSVPRAREIAETLKSWIMDGGFLLARPAELLPGPGESPVSQVLKG
jgi:uncharacterized protein (DUF39 family)